jgi:anti-sigma regulatory factor (Ser/Thr protein kinase)
VTHDRTVVAIEEPDDVGVCRRRAASFASRLGFADVAVGEVAILVTELAENVIRHGGAMGELRLGEVEEDGRRGMVVICRDSGPGLDPQVAVADGFSTVDSLGVGLGAVRRLADSCQVRRRADGPGSEVVAVKWLPAVRGGPADETAWVADRLLIGARSRAYPGLAVNGDAYAVRFPGPGRVVAAVIDGLGHGVEAHVAATAASEYIEQHAGEPLEEQFDGLHRRLRNTRGAVAAIADIDLDAEILRFAGVGNIEATVFSDEAALSLVSTGGIIGHNVRRWRTFEYPWGRGRTLVMCSDGVRSGWRASVEPQLLKGHPEVLAETIIHQCSRSTDDATALGIREKE